jgi:hypothetical protein
MAASNGSGSGEGNGATLVAPAAKEKPPDGPAVPERLKPEYVRPYNDRPNEKAEPNNKKESSCRQKLRDHRMDNGDTINSTPSLLRAYFFSSDAGPQAANHYTNDSAKSAPPFASI